MRSIRIVWPAAIAALAAAVAAALAGARATAADADAAFRVVRVTPADGATGVDPDPLIQIHTSEKFDPRTVDARAVALRGPDGAHVAVSLTPDLGGVITVSVERPLELDRLYRIEVGTSLKSLDGASIRPFSSTFRTTAVPARPGPTAGKYFQFSRARIDRRDGVCGLALLPPHTLLACTWDGRLLRYRLDPHGMLEGEPQLVLHRPQRRFLSLVAEPGSEQRRPAVWLSHDSLARQSLGPNDYSGTISRVTLGDEGAEVEDFVIGLPTGDHPATGLTFGPQGQLYVSQGALTMLGDKPSLKETPLSAAVLEIDLRDPAFSAGRRPLDVRTDVTTPYDPARGPVRVYATGIREAYDLCWHSNGQLYAGVNMNDTAERTPATPEIPAVNARPPEMLIRVVPGKYYGHPNPSRHEWVLLGGNPTPQVDPWEVPEYPVGVLPERHFDPTLLIRNLEQDKGTSANGCVEWTGPGPLRGRLLICFYTATRGIHTYQFSEDGTSVVDHQPLLDAQGELLRFASPLDVVYHPSGWLYVADFTAPQRGDSGRDGGVWKVTPLVPPRPR